MEIAKIYPINSKQPVYIKQKPYVDTIIDEVDVGYDGWIE